MGVVTANSPTILEQLEALAGQFRDAQPKRSWTTLQGLKNTITDPVIEDAWAILDAYASGIDLLLVALHDAAEYADAGNDEAAIKHLMNESLKARMVL